MWCLSDVIKEDGKEKLQAIFKENVYLGKW